MRKFGLIAAIVGFGMLGADLVLRLLLNFNSWLWLPGFLALVGGAAMVLRSRWSAAAPVVPAPKAMPVNVSDTARLLDNFEQRFAELKGRKPSVNVISELYALGTQLEQRGRTVQATAVYRHLARLDNTYKDVSTRLARLMDAERAKPKPAPAPTPAAIPVPSPIKIASGGAAAATSPGVTSASTEATSAGSTTSVHNYNVAPDGTDRLGRYQLEREIGRGAMGIVYLGRDTAINRQVAIKAIPLAAEFSDAELDEARARFFREAETAGRLNHPCIVTIYDVGEERGLAYIAMEYLKGRHLSDYATANNLLEPRKVLEVIGRTAEALGFAHKQQVVHRDIKPANLMYDPSADVLKITDFGIARLTGAGSTRTGIVLGTPSFMSPEQLEGRTVTGHSDLFSLGVSLFQLLTGQLPFTADSMTGLMQQIAEAPHPPLRAFRPDLPACVESVIDRALAKSPDARFDSGAQMAAALDDCRSRIPSGLP
jgi:eukaryotic-like serine/threonine-protein kinase